MKQELVEHLKSLEENPKPKQHPPKPIFIINLSTSDSDSNDYSSSSSSDDGSNVLGTNNKRSRVLSAFKGGLSKKKNKSIMEELLRHHLWRRLFSTPLHCQSLINFTIRDFGITSRLQLKRKRVECC